MTERKYKRIFTIVIDSLGVGALEDAASYGMRGRIRWDIFLRAWRNLRFPICRRWVWPTCIL